MSAFKDHLESLVARAEALEADILLLSEPSAKHLCASQLLRAHFRAQDTRLMLQEAKARTDKSLALEASNAG